MDEVYRALLQNKTRDFVPFNPSMNIIVNKWVFMTKKKGDGTIGVYKTRLVAQGFKELEEIDFNLVYSPVVKSPTIRIILSLAVSRDSKMFQLTLKMHFCKES